MGRKLGGVPLPEAFEARCLACSGPLYFNPDSYPLVLHCGSGHFLTVQDLLDASLPPGRTPPTAALQTWEQRCRLFEDLARDALVGGHALAAADLQETALRIDLWVLNLRKLLAS